MAQMFQHNNREQQRKEQLHPVWCDVSGIRKHIDRKELSLRRRDSPVNQPALRELFLVMNNV